MWLEDPDFCEEVEDAFANGVKRHHSLKVRLSLSTELSENGWLSVEDSYTHCGLATDYSKSGRPELYVSVPEPTSLLPDQK